MTIGRREERFLPDAGLRLDVYLDDDLRDGDVVRAGSMVFIGTRPLTDLELAGAEARHLVRVGMAEVLLWLGETIGDPPQRSGRGQRLLEALREAAQ